LTYFFFIFIISVEWEFGLPWTTEGAIEYQKWSPEEFVSEWKTPTLVVQGGKDYRVCEGEGISTFTALQRKGIESKLLFFPDEGHWVLKPHNSEMWYRTIFEWLEKHLKN
jgi:dipeptidyl aminopeptidase/acylaminoacyl peptidase